MSEQVFYFKEEIVSVDSTYKLALAQADGPRQGLWLQNQSTDGLDILISFTEEGMENEISLRFPAGQLIVLDQMTLQNPIYIKLDTTGAETADVYIMTRQK